MAGLTSYRSVTAAGDLADEIAVIRASMGSMIVDAEIAISAATEIPSDVHTVIESGGSFAIAAGKTLTINGPLTAVAEEVFTGDGTVVLGPKVVDILPEWFGATIGGPAANDAIKEALTHSLADNTIYKQVRLSQAGDYEITSTAATQLLLSNRTRFQIDGVATLKLTAVDAARGALAVTDAVGGSKEDITILGSGTIECRGAGSNPVDYGILLYGAKDITIGPLTIVGPAADGIYIAEGDIVKYCENVVIQDGFTVTGPGRNAIGCTSVKELDIGQTTGIIIVDPTTDVLGAGINLENQTRELTTERLTGVHIVAPTITYNSPNWGVSGQVGILLQLAVFGVDDDPGPSVDITITDPTILGAYFGMSVQCHETLEGNIDVSGLQTLQTGYSGIWIVDCPVDLAITVTDPDIVDPYLVGDVEADPNPGTFGAGITLNRGTAPASTHVIGGVSIIRPTVRKTGATTWGGCVTAVSFVDNGPGAPQGIGVCALTDPVDLSGTRYTTRLVFISGEASIANPPYGLGDCALVITDGNGILESTDWPVDGGFIGAA